MADEPASRLGLASMGGSRGLLLLPRRQMVKDGGDPCYRDYANAAKTFGLTPGLFFSTPDAGHVQKRSAAGATNVYKWSEIDAIMKARFSEKPDGVV